MILASDVFGSGANIETLLFGSLLLVDGGDIALAAGAAAATLLASALIGQHWLRTRLRPDAWPNRAAEPAALLDAVLLALIALATTAALTVVGALLVAALFVVPAATARLLTRRLASWQLASVALVALEGTVGLWLSVKTDAPPGATIACVAGAVFALVAAGRALRRARAPRPRRGRPRSSWRCSPPAAGRPAGGSDGQLDVVVDHHPARRLGPRGRRRSGRGRPDPPAQHRPPRVRAAAQRRRGRRRARSWSSPAATTSTAGSTQVVSDSGSDAEVVDLGAAVPDRLPGED